MIQEREQIIFTSEVRVVATIKESESLKTGVLLKKVVITTSRCLIFQSLTNVISDMEYDIMDKKKHHKKKGKKEEEEKEKRISINLFPEVSFSVEDRTTKIILDEEPSCIRYLAKLGLSNLIKEIKGTVILKNVTKNKNNEMSRKFELFLFSGISEGFRFCKAISCAQAWVKYQKYCEENNVEVNYNWCRILIQITEHENSVVLIDPDLFLTGSNEQIKSFKFLIDKIPFAHSFQHRYSIINNQIGRYAQQFIDFFQKKTTSLNLSNTNLTNNLLSLVLHERIVFEELLNLDLSKNELTDDAFIYLQNLAKKSKNLSYYNLSSNKINFNNSGLFIALLKSTQIILTIDLSNNEIRDSSIESIEKYILFSPNPPIQEINLSFNKFTKKGIWRLFIGNLKNMKEHDYMNFIIYPLPFKPDIFPKYAIDYPIQTRKKNFNIHSALIEQFQQQSFMKHSLHEIIPSQASTIRFTRQMNTTSKLPQTKQQVHRTLQLSNKIENFLYSSKQVESIYDLAKQIQEFQLNVPPISRHRFITFLSDKLNEALFIRDHYSVREIRKSFDAIGVEYNEYHSRLNMVEKRDEKIVNIIQSIMNLDINEDQVNNQLDYIVKEGLRLYLQGEGIQIVYYLKYLRDRQIQNLLYQKYSPEHYIEEKRAEKNLNFDDKVSQKDFRIPYEIRVQRKINENFYLHPWKTNYLILSQLPKSVFDDCLQFLQKSKKAEKFAQQFDRMEERIQFIRSEFNHFSFSKFKYSYSDLKINCARLLSMYHHITNRELYLIIPHWTRKKPITKEKRIRISNKRRFIEENHIKMCEKINNKARQAVFFNYKDKITRYDNEVFNNEVKKLLETLKPMLKTIREQERFNSKQIPEKIVGYCREIIKKIRETIYPNELKQEFYLQLMAWKEGKYASNIKLFEFLPFFTMYIKPPASIEKYLIAMILQNENLNLPDLPLCVTYEPKETELLSLNHREFVQRDWIGTNNHLCELMHNNGQVQLKIEFLVKEDSIKLMVAESSSVREVVQQLFTILEDPVEDIQHFWLYIHFKAEKRIKALEECECVGEIISEHKEKQYEFLFKRRVYCLEWQYIYKKYSKNIINSLYYDWRNQYRSGDFFAKDKISEELAAKLIIVDITEDPKRKKSVEEAASYFIKNTLKDKYADYIPVKVMHRMMKTKEDIIANITAKISQKVLKKHHNSLLDLKIQVLEAFEGDHEFCSTNHIFQDHQFSRSVKLSINILYLYVDSEQSQKIELQKIIKIIPKANHLFILYHRSEGIYDNINCFGDEKTVIEAAHDILAYCQIRMKMVYSSLGEAHKYDSLYSQAKNNRMKDKNINKQLSILKKKLEGMSPTLMNIQNLIYFNKNNYIKVYSNRKLYANSSDEQLPEEAILSDSAQFRESQVKNSEQNMYNIRKDNQYYGNESSLHLNAHQNQYDSIPSYNPPEQEPETYKKEGQMEQEKRQYFQPQNPFQTPNKPKDEQPQVINTAQRNRGRAPPPRRNR